MATEKLQVFKCNVCGNMVEMVHAGAGRLTCCKQPMELLNAGSTDAALEKHVPVVVKTDDGIKVSVGSIAHPMEEKHSIEWVEAVVDGKAYRQFLNPGDAPEVFFPIVGKNITVREFCNLHGLWQTV